MKITLHKSETRGLAKLAWLNSRHTFSFSAYHNPERMGFGKLRVLNDDIVQASMGFGTHPHSDMEIISIPLTGSIRHTDSMGNEHIIRSGEVQIMSAGTGIQHSEYNNSDTDAVNFLQIWVLPKLRGVEPRYEQKQIDVGARKNQLQRIVSPSGDSGSVQINQDAYLSLADIEKGQSLHYPLNTKNNGVYVFLISGEISIGDSILKVRDGAELTDLSNFTVLANQDAEVLFVEVAVT